MRDSERAIEKVLVGLRDAEAPEGMERRILDALAERGSVRTGFGWRSLVPVWGGMRVLVWGAGMAGLVVLALVIPAVRRAERTAERVGGDRAAAPSAAHFDRVDSEGVAKSELRVVGRKRAEFRAALVEGVVDNDALAVEEMQAASRPAPPLPLTEQERLMLRLVHSGDRQELAKLDPIFRIDGEAEETEFLSFFEPVDTTVEPDEKQSDSKVEKEGEER